MKIKETKIKRAKRALASSAFTRGQRTGGFQPAGVAAPVILLAHGSRRPGAHRTIDGIAERLGGESLGAGPVLSAFLDFSPRTLQAVAAELASLGHRQAIVVPLLFTSAFHLNQDVPRAIAHAESVSGLRLRATAPVGLGEDVADLLVDQWRETQGADIGDAVVYAVGSSTPGANQAVEALAQKVGERLGVPATAIFATGGGIGLAEHRARRGLQQASAHAATAFKVPLNTAPTAVLPLFFAPGLLLDKGLREAVSPGFLFSEPLGQRVVGVVENRILAEAARVEVRAS